jgi:tetratricopeptide (TPR) repeat protein
MMAEAEALFKEGMTFYRNGYWGKALDKVRQAVDADKQNPNYLSYYALLVALAKKSYDEAEKLGYMALKMDRKNVQAYLNLCEIYTRAKRKGDAVDALREGLRFTKRDKRLVKALGKLGVRQGAVFPFLARSNPLNVQAGKIRHTLTKPKK